MTQPASSPSRIRIFGRKLHSIVRAAVVAVNGLLACATVFSAYGGYFNPATLPLAALAAMILPGLLIAGVVMIIIDCVVNYRIATMIMASWLISLPPILTFFPLNITSPSLSEGQLDRSFTLLTYNTMHFEPYNRVRPDGYNGTISYILSTDADVVNLQEVEFFDSRSSHGISQQQVDSINARYPYIIIDAAQQLTVMSKYPVEPIPFTFPKRSVPCLIAGFRLNVDGTEVNLYNVHLKSIGLSTDDKTLYRQLPGKIKNDTGELREELRDVKSQLVSKLAQSFVTRSEEARWLREVIDSVGGNTIVAGDFNDIPGCYAQRLLMGDDLHDAYADNAFGPTITYHDNRFYFRIDHILYGGDLEAVEIRRDTPPWSDHYPLLTRILITDKQ